MSSLSFPSLSPPPLSPLFEFRRSFLPILPPSVRRSYPIHSQFSLTQISRVRRFGRGLRDFTATRSANDNSGLHPTRAHGGCVRARGPVSSRQRPSWLCSLCHSERRRTFAVSFLPTESVMLQGGYWLVSCLWQFCNLDVTRP